MKASPLQYLDLLAFLLGMTGVLLAIGYGRRTVASYWQRNKMYMIAVHIVTWCSGFVFFVWTGMEWAMMPLSFEAGVITLRILSVALHLFWIWTLFLLLCLYIFDCKILRGRDACASAAFIDCLLLMQATWHGALLYLNIVPFPV